MSTPALLPNIVLSDVEVLARTIWGEARGEDRPGREMVASVIMNRVKADLGNDGKPDWWGETVFEVCTAPFQFSCWLPNDPNRKKLLAVTEDDPVFKDCLGIAQAAIEGRLPDRTGGATHYLNPLLCERVYGWPKWAVKAELTATNGRHNFYRAS